MKFPSWRFLVLILVVAGFVGGAVALERQTIFRVLHDDATSTASAWTEFLAQNTADLDKIATGTPPSQETRAFIAKVKSVARVFLYKIYDANGVPRFVSDDLEEEAADEADLALHNPEAAEAIESGKPEVEIKEGTPPSRPAYYSEAYVPMFGKDGKVIAVVESYIDQTAKRAEFEQTFLFSATAIGFLIAAAFGVPAAAWFLRKGDQDRSEARIQYLANFDALSGLANRSTLTEGLTAALADATANGKMLAVHCIDIDSFKDINDRLGLGAGDHIIKIAGQRLQQLAGPGDIVARLAGDEFAIVQRTPRDRVDAEVMARKITSAMAEPVALGGDRVALTVGVGVALAPDHGKDAERLIKSAELALAKVKLEGRGRARFFTRDLDNETNARLRLERIVENALNEDGFALHFQPLYSEPGETLTGFEALARLPSPEGGFIPPVEFIPTAERMGVIHHLGGWVLHAACNAAKTWPEHLSVSVNLSPAQFGKGTIVEVVGDALKDSGLEPRRLLLEITESLLLADSDTIMAELGELKALGAEIVMDDFGTGYSSLSYLWRFPFDKIKIDGSFMRAFDTPGGPAEKVVRTIITLGHTLGMRVCVEGVETADHAAYVRALGCDEVQGFQFGRPMAAIDVPATIVADFRKDASPGSERAGQRSLAAGL